MRSNPANDLNMIEEINSLNNGWTAGVSSRFDDMTIDEVKAMLGALPGGPILPRKVVPHTLISSLDVPENFDSRTEWGSTCPSLNEVRDQGACGSCWAVGAAAAMTDRLCIATKGETKPHLSSQDLVSCCDSCGMGCSGGYPSAAWDYFVNTGLVSGGPWNSKQGCYPYQIESCDHHVNGTRKPCGEEQPTPQCQQSCQDGSQWESDKHKGKTSYSLGDVSQIQADILQYGPVEAAFSVYSDFLSYKSGVYRHTTGGMLGGHAVRVLGWGTENGSPYWLIANSWNEDWGDKGLFKILRGSDECGIDSGMVAGLAA